MVVVDFHHNYRAMEEEEDIVVKMTWLYYQDILKLLLLVITELNQFLLVFKELSRKLLDLVVGIGW